MGEMGEMGDHYLNFYKICRAEPTSYRECECSLKGCCEEVPKSGKAALDNAESIARNQIGTLPPLTKLAAYREKRGLYWYERNALTGATSTRPSPL